MEQGLPLERYAQAIRKVLESNKENQQCLVYVASDGSREEMTPLLTEFSDRIIWIPPLERASLAGSRRALVDMLLLSRTQFLILTPLSSFGEMAAFQGNVPYVYA